ncbi:hypothetical protein [Faecalimicrobium dakarense]|uniref:hypothetical protein n=1 Tax=Faecalimicrobium dakarense TaxID=1301100 RepID=UPI0004BC05D9|nr:hypothetical protein [[Clostridium] dakarense]
MSQLCKLREGNVGLCPVSANKIYDSVRSTSNINSNLPITFKVFSECDLPINTKIDITGTKFEYSIFNIKKDVLINGHKVLTDSSLKKDKICLKKEYVNLIDKNCESLLLNITENIKFNLKINIKIKGTAHINECKSVYFEAFGEGRDCINTIIVSEIFVPNFLNCNSSVYLSLENEIIGVANPEYTFLSPIYDCKSNIEHLLGNVFTSYTINLNIASLIPSYLELFAYK